MKNTMVGPTHINNNESYDEKDRISGKPPVFDGENFDYQKDKTKVFLAHDTDLWDMVTDGNIYPVDKSGQKIE